MTVLLFFPIIWSAIACGSKINVLAGASPADAPPIERRLYGLSTGLLLLAYTVLALGLVGVLSAAPILLICLAEAAIGWDEHRLILNELLAGASRLKFSPVDGICALLFTFFAATALVGCFTPPTSIEYDALVYHLGDPKIYLANHRVIYLPWESHSNFAFTMEMLYTVGLAVKSVALAKLFHWTLGVAAATATFLIGRRIHSLPVGLVAALIFVSMPIVFWEAGTAYVDLAATAFGALGLLALISALQSADSDRSWLRVSMIMMACMLSVKATSLIPMMLMAAGIVGVYYYRSKDIARSASAGAAYGVGCLLLGSVWYVKSWIVTGNPFFPFGYSIFGGRHWSSANALVYSQSQSAFGMGHSAFNLLLAPWNLTLYVLPWNLSGQVHYFNDFAAVFITLSPMLLATLFLPAFWNRSSSGATKILAVFGLLSLLIWFALTQQIRYLLLAMPVYSVLAAIVMVELWKVRSISRYALAGLFGLSLCFAAYVAYLLVQIEAPVALGFVDKTRYISTGFPPYSALNWINRSTPSNAGVLIYGEPEDFYLSRRYMWGEPGHGIVIPYDSMQSPSNLKNWMMTHNYQYIFINAVNAKIGPGGGMNGLVYGLTYGSGNSPVFQDRAFTVWQVQ